MNTKFIFIFIFALFVKHNTCMRSYFLNSDPVEENGKEKRSSEKFDSFDDFDVTNVKKDLTDYDYKNGNAESEMEEPETDQVKNIEKRETKVIADIQSFSDADIELALSKLSEEELEVLEKLMENEVATSKVTKRGVTNNDWGKVCDSRYGCKSKHSDEFEDGNYKQIITYEQLPDELPKNRKIIKRLSRFSPLSREEILQARIDFLKDNYERQSEIGKIENSFKRKERYERDVGKEVIRNPYFNSLIGPRSRSKRSVETTHNVNPMDDPKSDAHIKLLEESFPNPNPGNTLDSDQAHIRVKRS